MEDKDTEFPKMSIKRGIPHNAEKFDIEISTNFKCAGTLEYKDQKNVIEKYFRENMDPFFSERFIRIVNRREAPFFIMSKYINKDVGVVFYVFVYASEEEVVEAIKDIKDCEEIINTSYRFYETVEVVEEEISEELKALED